MLRVTTLDKVLLGIRDRLISESVFPAGAVFLTVTPDQDIAGAPSGPYAGISFLSMDQPSDILTSDADATRIPWIEGDVTIALWIRVQIDESGTDDEALTSASIGAIGVIQQILAALNGYELLNDDSEEILHRPIVTLGVRNRGRTPSGWRRFDIRFNVAFVWDLT